jgi:hypothetical protein
MATHITGNLIYYDANLKRYSLISQILDLFFKDH